MPVMWSAKKESRTCACASNVVAVLMKVLSLEEWGQADRYLTRIESAEATCLADEQLLASESFMCLVSNSVKTNVRARRNFTAEAASNNRASLEVRG